MTAKKSIRLSARATVHDVQLFLCSGYSKVTIPNFGVFELSDRAGFKTVNPMTGDDVDVPPLTSINFRPSKALKNVVRLAG